MLALGVITMTSCSLFGSKNGAPLSGAERPFFTTVTNYVLQPVWQTNTVNEIVQTIVPVTNTVGAVIFQTNLITVPVPTPMWITNVFEQYTHTPNETAQASAGVAGTIANLIIPGSGGAITTGILALLGIWGGWRSKKNKDTGIALSQEIETILEFVYSLPKGAAYHETIVRFLKDHQVEAGVAQEVLKILEKNISNKDAVAAMEGIRLAISTMGTVMPPREAPPTTP